MPDSKSQARFLIRAPKRLPVDVELAGGRMGFTMSPMWLRNLPDAARGPRELHRDASKDVAKMTTLFDLDLDAFCAIPARPVIVRKPLVLRPNGGNFSPSTGSSGSVVDRQELTDQSRASSLKQDALGTAIRADIEAFALDVDAAFAAPTNSRASSRAQAIRARLSASSASSPSLELACPSAGRSERPPKAQAIQSASDAAFKPPNFVSYDNSIDGNGSTATKCDLPSAPALIWQSCYHLDPAFHLSAMRIQMMPSTARMTLDEAYGIKKSTVAAVTHLASASVDATPVDSTVATTHRHGGTSVEAADATIISADIGDSSRIAGISREEPSYLPVVPVTDANLDQDSATIRGVQRTQARLVRSRADPGDESEFNAEKDALRSEVEISAAQHSPQSGIQTNASRQAGGDDVLEDIARMLWRRPARSQLQLADSSRHPSPSSTESGSDTVTPRAGAYDLPPPTRNDDVWLDITILLEWEARLL
ncbi:hypothetical protein WOLCODRAFT_164796 [Wolfiporia cocos MD-104 SS10]|uniref:Uncharacterized protein n=1 Tax=Wolfiporia cocos (strain MD-104) TaxID=742152 RepID=A0A2H3K620_WOLCO|nr:hypothetical protein WOLCODRAFT_164796 [Wolfiporia cocos MD-104 SS10]